MRRLAAVLAMASAAILLHGSNAQAGTFSTAGFADLGTPTANTGNILTATSFTLGNLVTNSSTTGAFTPLSAGESFGSVTFSVTPAYPTMNTSLSFGDSQFGTFQSGTIQELVSTSTSITYYVVGTYTPGSLITGITMAVPASLTISFTQTGGGAISDSATISVPPALAVPEPAGLAMGLTGIALCGLVHFRRRRRRGAA